MIKCPIYKTRLAEKINEWKEVLNNGVDRLLWWELLVKPGIGKLGLERGKEINKEKRLALNLLLDLQAHILKKIKEEAYGHLDITDKKIRLTLDSEIGAICHLFSTIKKG